eukprot:CAMPEP_0173092756 /NCGR_PEP_ID=MMETSP1102-20130122/29331_1 /TAXON_ID=49646 /ORGANISM="Geminigera sp., Strain Caron Lab Isolate" /LENGTH=100 /DNA_ID=CAMNT_0013980135 /DNA_START=317 /DNA_END=619 /DNA_ORIENTATION=+
MAVMSPSDKDDEEMGSRTNENGAPNSMSREDARAEDEARRAASAIGGGGGGMASALARNEAVQQAAMSAASDPAVQKAAISGVKDNPSLAVQAMRAARNV